MNSATLTESSSFSEQKSEIKRLSDLLTQNNIQMCLLDLGAIIAFEAMTKRGEVEEAYSYLLDHMQKTARRHGLF